MEKHLDFCNVQVSKKCANLNRYYVKLLSRSLNCMSVLRLLEKKLNCLIQMPFNSGKEWHVPSFWLQERSANQLQLMSQICLFLYIPVGQKRPILCLLYVCFPVTEADVRSKETVSWPAQRKGISFSLPRVRSLHRLKSTDSKHVTGGKVCRCVTMHVCRSHTKQETDSIGWLELKCPPMEQRHKPGVVVTRLLQLPC